jgi:hypothetical protein
VVRVPGYRSRGPGFDPRHYQTFWEVVRLEQDPFSLVSTIEELLGRNSSGSGLENREYCRGDPLHWIRNTPYPQNLALTSPTSGGRSVGIVRLQTKATEFVSFCLSVLKVVLDALYLNCLPVRRVPTIQRVITATPGTNDRRDLTASIKPSALRPTVWR